ncbi:MAG: polysaccharide pyruvyl transferase family protein [Colwellia sp.]
MYKTFEKSLMFIVKQYRRLFSNSQNEIWIFIPASDGSLGDQALLQPFQDKYASAFKIKLVRIKGMVPINLKEKCEEHFVIEFGSRKNRIDYILSLRKCHRVFVLGADIFDGRYYLGQSVAYIKYTDIAARLNIKCKFVGFSFSKNPKAEVVDAVKSSHKDIIYLLRDPASHERFINDTGRNCAQLVADNAFNLLPELKADSAIACKKWLDDLPEKSIVLGLNVNVLTFRGREAEIFKAITETVCGYLNENQHRYVVYIPHDFREQQSDWESHKKIMENLSEEHKLRCFSLEKDINAWDVKAITKYVDMVLTGRMHLAIAALGQLTPALCITYVNKFEGLLKHFKLDDFDMVLEPEIAYSDSSNTLVKINNILSDLDKITATIKVALPEVKALATCNLD